MATLIAPHLEHGSGTPAGFTRFRGVEGATAQALLALLPEGNRAERQNGGPRCDLVLRAAARWPGEVEVSGYLVSPPRWDERVGIDGLVVHSALVPPPGSHGLPRHAHLSAGVGPPVTSTREEVWEGIRRTLELGALTQEPDELMPFLPEGRGGRLAWWVWWD